MDAAERRLGASDAEEIVHDRARDLLVRVRKLPGLNLGAQGRDLFLANVRQLLDLIHELADGGRARRKLDRIARLAGSGGRSRFGGSRAGIRDTVRRRRVDRRSLWIDSHRLQLLRGTRAQVPSHKLSAKP